MSISITEIQAQPATLSAITMDQLAVGHEQRLTNSELGEVFGIKPGFWLLPTILSDFESSAPEIPSPDIPSNNCTLNYFMIEGASPRTDIPPSPLPLDIPCRLTTDEQGKTILVLDEVSLSKFVEPGQNAIIISPFPGLTAGTNGQPSGRIPVWVQTHISSEYKDGATTLCPIDWFSNLIFNNPSQGSGFAQNSSETSACFDASAQPVDVFMYDNQGNPHPIRVVFDNSGNTFLFPSTTLTESGLLQIDLSNRPQYASFLQGALMEGLRKQLGDNVVVLIAPNGFTLDVSHTPIFETPTQPEITPVFSEPTQTPTQPSQSSNPESLAGIAPEQESDTRPIIGTNIRSSLTCLKGCNLNILYVDESVVLGQDLKRELIHNPRSSIIPDITQQLRNETKWWRKALNRIHNCFALIRGEEKIKEPAITQMNLRQGVSFPDLRILKQERVGHNDLIIYATIAASDNIVIITSSVKDWDKYTESKFVDDSGTIDQIGTTILNKVTTNLAIPDPPIHQNRNNQDLFYFPPYAITTTQSISYVESDSANNLKINPYASGWVYDKTSGNVIFSDRIPSNLHGQDTARLTLQRDRDGNTILVRWLLVYMAEIDNDSPFFDPNQSFFEIGIPFNHLTTDFSDFDTHP